MQRISHAEACFAQTGGDMMTRRRSGGRAADFLHSLQPGAQQAAA